MKAILTGIFLALAAPALAQQCGAESIVEARLEGMYGEAVFEEETRTIPNGGSALFQIWLNQETGTWTFTGSMNGIICLMAAGEDYQGQVIADFLDGEAA